MALPRNCPQDGQFIELANCQSRSEFVEKSMHFYMGYLVTDDTTEYLSKALLTSMQGMLDSNDDRMRSLLFKLCVETNMMMHVIAAHFKDDIGDLRVSARLRRRTLRLGGA